MNIYIRYYQNHTSQFGNCSTDVVHIKGSEIQVSELKSILSEKYKIPPCNQRLTYKIADEFLVMLTNNWPLSFYHIKENSHVYLELLEEVNKQEEINKRILSATKSKYLKSLGFFNHFSTNLGVIPESNNEYNDEIIAKRSRVVHNSSFTEDEQTEILLNAIKNNNINQVRELLEQYDDIDINRLASNGWAPIHSASYYGFTEILIEILGKKADANILNKEGWTALHLATYKGNEEAVKILINAPDIEINRVVSGIGTPLHCASKKNYMKIVSLLLFNADIE